jgi:transposase InsO family protein
MSKVKCFVCKKFGHYAGQFLNRKKKKGGTAATTEETDFQTQFQKECAFHVCYSSVEYSPHIWYIDSGASSHITGIREHFSDLRDTEVRIDISLGDNRIVTVVGIGTVSFRREDLPPISFTDVLFIPGMKKNLILVSTLQDRGFEVSFRGTEVLIYPQGCSIDSGQVIGVREGDLYRLLFQPLLALVASSNSSGQLCELWHRRMAHLHHGALGGRREVVTGVPQIIIEHQDVCRGCALGKFSKASFPSSDSKSAGILDLVHMDVCGPMSRNSLSGCEYYLTFIDDYSRKTWIYFLKTKSEVFARFQEFRALVENHSGKRIKVLRSDNGGEYSSRQFVDFCAQHGIRRQMTVPYNPQQNGVAERKNRAITGVARSMLHDQSLPLYLWVEACATAVYLQNRSPHRILGKMTPEEAFTGRRPDVEHIRIFGCSNFSHVPSERRTKLDPTAQQGILVGYSEVSKAYRIYIMPLRKVVVSRYVRFEEDKAFARSLESSRAVEDDVEFPVAISEGAHPQRSGTPASGVIRSPCTASGSQSEHVQSDGAQTSEGGQTSGSQSVEVSPEAITLGQRDLTSPLTNSGKMRPRWFQETLKEAIENVGEPKSQIRQRRPPVRLGAYLALVTTIRDIEPLTFV